jgi:ribonuclease VapC
LSCFVDSSAIVAILAREPDRDALLKKLDSYGAGYVSPLVTYESCLAVSRLIGLSTTASEEVFATFATGSKLVLLAIDGTITTLALQAFTTFGKGRHQASLNIGDCFSYACAKMLRVPLLCKGDDFVHTDIRMA